MVADAGSTGGGGGSGLGLVGGPFTGASAFVAPSIALASSILGGWLFFFWRRRKHQAMDASALALEGAALGPPPQLVPAAIFREVLYDPEELTPVWAKPRAAPEADPVPSPDPVTEATTVAAAAPTDEPKPAKRARRPKATGTPDTATKTRPKRIPKPKPDAT